MKLRWEPTEIKAYVLKYQETGDEKWLVAAERMTKENELNLLQEDADKMAVGTAEAYGDPAKDEAFKLEVPGVGKITGSDVAGMPGELLQSAADVGPMIGSMAAAGAVPALTIPALALNVADIYYGHPLGKIVREKIRGLPPAPEASSTDKWAEAGMFGAGMLGGPLGKVIGGGLGLYGAHEKYKAADEAMRSLGMRPTAMESVAQAAAGQPLMDEYGTQVHEGSPFGAALDLHMIGKGGGELLTGPKLPFGFKNPVGDLVGRGMRSLAGEGADAQQFIEKYRGGKVIPFTSDRMGDVNWVDNRIQEFTAITNTGDAKVEEAWVDNTLKEIDALNKDVFETPIPKDGTVYGRNKASQSKAFVDLSAIERQWINGDPINIVVGDGVKSTITTKNRSFADVKKDVLRHELAHIQQWRQGFSPKYSLSGEEMSPEELVDENGRPSAEVIAAKEQDAEDIRAGMTKDPIRGPVGSRPDVVQGRGQFGTPQSAPTIALGGGPNIGQYAKERRDILKNIIAQREASARMESDLPEGTPESWRMEDESLPPQTTSDVHQNLSGRFNDAIQKLISQKAAQTDSIDSDLPGGVPEAKYLGDEAFARDKAKTEEWWKPLIDSARSIGTQLGVMAPRMDRGNKEKFDIFSRLGDLWNKMKGVDPTSDLYRETKQQRQELFDKLKDDPIKYLKEQKERLTKLLDEAQQGKKPAEAKLIAKTLQLVRGKLNDLYNAKQGKGVHETVVTDRMAPQEETFRTEEFLETPVEPTGDHVFDTASARERTRVSAAREEFPGLIDRIESRRKNIKRLEEKARDIEEKLNRFVEDANTKIDQKPVPALGMIQTLVDSEGQHLSRIRANIKHQRDMLAKDIEQAQKAHTGSRLRAPFRDLDPEVKVTEGRVVPKEPKGSMTSGSKGMEPSPAKTDKPLMGWSNGEVARRLRALAEDGIFPEGDTPREQLQNYIESFRSNEERAKYVDSQPSGEEVYLKVGSESSHHDTEVQYSKKAIAKVEDALGAGHTLVVPATDSYLGIIKKAIGYLKSNPDAPGRLKIVQPLEKSYTNQEGQMHANSPWAEFTRLRVQDERISMEPAEAEPPTVSRKRFNGDWMDKIVQPKPVGKSQQPKSMPSWERASEGRKFIQLTGSESTYDPKLAPLAHAVFKKMNSSNNATIDHVLMEAVANTKTGTVGQHMVEALMQHSWKPKIRKQFEVLKEELDVRREAAQYFNTDHLGIIKEADGSVSFVINEKGQLANFDKAIPRAELQRMIEDIQAQGRMVGPNQEVGGALSRVLKAGAKESPDTIMRRSIGKRWDQLVEDLRGKNLISVEALADLGKSVSKLVHTKTGMGPADAAKLREAIFKSSGKALDEMFAKAKSDKETTIYDKAADFFAFLRDKVSGIMPGSELLQHLVVKAGRAWSGKGVEHYMSVTGDELNKTYNSTYFQPGHGKVSVPQLMDFMADMKQQGKQRVAEMSNKIREIELIDNFLNLNDNDITTKMWHMMDDPTLRRKVEARMTAKDKALMKSYDAFVKADAQWKTEVYGKEQFQAMEKQKYFRRQLRELLKPEDLRQMDATERQLISQYASAKVAEAHGVEFEGYRDPNMEAVFNNTPGLKAKANKYAHEAVKMSRQILAKNPEAVEAVINVVNRHIRRTFGAMTEENLAKTIVDDTFLDNNVDVGGDVMSRTLLGGYGDAGESDVRNVIPRQIQTTMKTLPNVQLARVARDFITQGNEQVASYFQGDMKRLKDYVSSELRNTFFGGVIEDTMAPSIAAKIVDKILGTRLEHSPNALWATSNAVAGYMYRTLLSWRENFLAMNTLDPVLKTLIRYDTADWIQLAVPTYIRIVGESAKSSSKIIELIDKYIPTKGSINAEIQGGTRASKSDTGFAPGLAKKVLGDEGYVGLHRLWMKGPELIEKQEHLNNRVIWSMETNKLLYKKGMVNNNPMRSLIAKHRMDQMLDVYNEHGAKAFGMTEDQIQRQFRAASAELESIQGHRQGFMGGSEEKGKWLAEGKNNVKAALNPIGKMFMNYPITVMLGLIRGSELAMQRASASHLSGDKATAALQFLGQPMTLMAMASAAAYYGIPYGLNKALGKEDQKFDPGMIVDAMTKDMTINRAPVPIGLGLAGMELAKGGFEALIELGSGEGQGMTMSEFLNSSQGAGRMKRSAINLLSAGVPMVNPLKHVMSENTVIHGAYHRFKGDSNE